ncbi:MAG: VCBS repeat-containing protein, partial [Bacteroidota bacterium]
MKKIIVSMAIFLATIGVGKAQYSFYFNDNIPVIVNGDTLTIPWAGGMNNPQFSTIDLNGDGLQDLFVFDRDGNKVITFINTGTPNAVSYRYAPEYQAKFPTNMTNWALLADYNCDGKLDIYTYNSTGTGGGMTLYRNDYSSVNGLQFSLIATTVMTVWGTQHENLYVSPVNLPTILDMDGDGMVDVLSFAPLGNIIYFHRNVAIDDGKTCDSVDFKTLVNCWGNCGTQSNANCFQLGIGCRLNAHDSAIFSPGWMKHSGGCLCGLDLNGDGAKEVIVGDVVSNSADALYNGGTPQAANITSQDCLYPSSDVSINIPAFPCCFHVDVDNDGKRDLICAPNAPGVSENTHGIWYYKNFGTDANPIFHYQTDSFMQGKMIEVGQNSMPVLFDYDNDGLKDLVIGNYGYFDTVGSYKSGLSLFRNTGTSSHPAFTLMTQDWANINSLHVNA